jgi:hypothetical protein
VSGDVHVALAACIILTLAALAVAGWSVLAVADMREQVDRADDQADLALGKACAIEDHLTGIERAPSGRHADPAPPAWPARDGDVSQTAVSQTATG